MDKDFNKDLVRRYVDTWNRGDVAALCDFFSPDMIHHTRTGGHGYESVKGIIAAFMGAFSDLHFDLEDIVAEDDRVVTRMTARATQSGNFMGVPATGKKIECAVVGIARVQGDKIVEHWGVTDELAMMQQLGLIPEAYLVAMS